MRGRLAGLLRPILNNGACQINSEKVIHISARPVCLKIGNARLPAFKGGFPGFDPAGWVLACLSRPNRFAGHLCESPSSPASIRFARRFALVVPFGHKKIPGLRRGLSFVSGVHLAKCFCRRSRCHFQGFHGVRN